MHGSAESFCRNTHWEGRDAAVSASLHFCRTWGFGQPWAGRQWSDELVPLRLEPHGVCALIGVRARGRSEAQQHHLCTTIVIGLAPQPFDEVRPAGAIVDGELDQGCVAGRQETLVIELQSGNGRNAQNESLAVRDNAMMLLRKT